MILTLGLNHHSAPLAIRERVAFGPDKMQDAFFGLMPLANEALILSTCNRTEIYAVGSDSERLTQWLADFHAIAIDEIRPYLYVLENDDSVIHAFQVASGLDSMVLGEPQILGQMKEALRLAEKNHAVASIIQKLFQSAFSAAKAVRSDTQIGANIVSMAAAAVHLAGRIFENISDCNVLFIGAGEMIDNCAAHFGAQHPKKIVVANRTVERATTLAAQYNGIAITLNALNDYLPSADIVISCTASPLPIIGLGLAERAIKTRKHAPIFMVDLAVPRDIEAEVGQLDDVFLYSVDDLQEVVQAGAKSRLNAALDAQVIVKEHAALFFQWQQSREVVPLIRALRENIERIRRTELEKALKDLKKGNDAQKVLEAFSQRLTNKFLHAPCEGLQNNNALKNAARQLFHLHDSSN